MSYEILTGESFAAALDSFHSSPVTADRAVEEFFLNESHQRSTLIDTQHDTTATTTTTGDALKGSNIVS